MKVKYLQSGSLIDLEREVNDFLDKGWIAQGNLLSWQEAPENNNPTFVITWFVQAIVYLKEIKT